MHLTESQVFDGFNDGLQFVCAPYGIQDARALNVFSFSMVKIFHCNILLLMVKKIQRMYFFLNIKGGEYKPTNISLQLMSSRMKLL